MILGEKVRDENEQILIIDDDESILRTLTLIFDKKGCETDTATTGREAIEKAKERFFNLALVDIKLPDMEGLDLLPALREIHPDIVLIIITAYASVDSAAEAPSRGVAAYLTKPLDVDELLAVAEEALDQQRLEREKRQAEQRIGEQYEFLHTVMESLTHPFYVIDADNYSIVMANSAANLRISEDAQTCYALTHGESGPCHDVEHVCPLDEVKISKGPVTVEHIHLDKDGNPRIVEVHGYPVFNAEGNVIQMIEYTFDITDQKKLEQQLLQAQKMEAVGRLAGGIAHDFNNALTVITGNTDLVLAALPEDSPHRTRILSIRKAAAHATELTQQLLAFSRKQIAAPRVLSVNEVVSDIQGMLQRVIGEDIMLVTRFGDDVGNIRMDPGQVEQVLMNLVVNAREAMPRGGALTIETAQVELDEAYVNTHPYVRPGQYARIAVSDTGTGMSNAVMEQLFEPFFTTKEGGTGLGLSTVYGIVKQNDGAINVYSEEGTGTTFKVYFPIVKESVDTSQVVDAGTIPPTGSETILMVEDEDAVRVLARDVLNKLGYEVHDFSSAEEALLFVEDYEGTIDLLLTDVIMPGTGGVELASTIQEAYPSVRVMFMSGYTNDTITQYGVLDEGVSLLQKPFTLTEIARKVREVLDA